MASVIAAMREHRIGASDVRTHATWTPEGSRSVLVAWLRSVGSVLTLPRGTIVHVHVSEGGSFVRKGVLLWCARLRRLPRVATVHGYGFDSFARRFPWLVRCALSPAQAVTVLTAEAHEAIRSLLPSVPVYALENPVKREHPVRPAGDQPQIVFFGGEVGRRKGVDVLLAAWSLVHSELPDASLHIAGPLGDLPQPTGAGVRYLGELSAQEVRREIARSRAVVLASRAEARPMLLLESAACARPFVATPVGSVPDVAAAGGTLVPVGNEQGLATALAKVLSDPVYATQLGDAAYEAAGKRDVVAVGAELERIYASLR